MQQATTIVVDYKSLYEAAKLQVMQLTFRVAQLEKMLFGSSHERLFQTMEQWLNNLLWVCRQKL
jgi:hypothetical protein